MAPLAREEGHTMSLARMLSRLVPQRIRTRVGDHFLSPRVS
jgi:hypothetical protein